MQHSLLRDGGQLLYDAFGALLFWLITIKCNHYYQMQLEFNIKFKMQHSLLREGGQLRRQNVLLAKDSQLSAQLTAM